MMPGELDEELITSNETRWNMAHGKASSCKSVALPIGQVHIDMNAYIYAH
jgi:hypothetical protein